MIDIDFFNIHFKLIENEKILIAQKYAPKKYFLEYHLDTIFNKQTI